MRRLLGVALLFCAPLAAAQSLDQLRAAREKAKADLGKAQTAFDQADEAYIKALSAKAGAPVAATPAAPPAPKPPADPSLHTVTFTYGDTPGAGGTSIYSAILIADGQASAKTVLPRSATFTPKATRTLSYEVWREVLGSTGTFGYGIVENKKLCTANLPLKEKTVVTYTPNGCTVQ